MVVNAIIAAMAKHGIAGKPGIKVYHVASSAVNPLLLIDVVKYSYEHFICSPIINMETERETESIKEMKLFSSMDDFSSHIQTEIAQQRRFTISGSNSNAFQRLQKKCKVIFEHAMDMAKSYQPYTFFKGR